MSDALLQDAPQKSKALTNAEVRVDRFYLAFLVCLLTILSYRINPWVAEGVLCFFGLGGLALYCYAAGMRRSERD